MNVAGTGSSLFGSRLAGHTLVCLVLAGCSPSPSGGFADWPVDSAGYEIEVLPVAVSASYARGDDVYLGLPSGEIRKARDSRLDAEWQDYGNPLGTGPRLLFASRSGVVFTGADHHSVYRTADGGATWQVCLDVPVWRMDEDDKHHLYAGNYTQDDAHSATLYKSTDDGLTWAAIWSDPLNRHIHTVRWDDAGKRLYIAFGDGVLRGRACSADRGATFRDLARHFHDGPTDVAFTDDFVFWGTDNGSGQLWRVSRAAGTQEELLGDSQYLWFTVAAGEQVYVGTVTARKTGGEHAALLASADQGANWLKLLEADESTGPYSRGFSAESRELSAGGWLYCTGGAEGASKFYRVRLRSGTPVSALGR
jgi:hypothetical protein